MIIVLMVPFLIYKNKTIYSFVPSHLAQLMFEDTTQDIFGTWYYKTKSKYNYRSYNISKWTLLTFLLIGNGYKIPGT